MSFANIDILQYILKIIIAPYLEKLPIHFLKKSKNRQTL